MDRIQNRPKIPSKIKTASETFKVDQHEIDRLKNESINSLLADAIMQKIIKIDLKLSDKEISENLPLLLEVQADKEACVKCRDKSKCPKTMKRRVITPVRNDDGTLTRNYSLCSKEQADFLVSTNFFLLSCPRSWVDGSKRNLWGQKSRFDTEGRGVMLVKKQALDAIAKIINGTSSDWVYLKSKFGQSKSIVLADSAALYARKHPGCAIASTPKLLEDLKSLSINNKSEFEKQLRRLQECPLLFLDEFGNEYQTEYSYSNILFPILSYRAREKMPIFFASNFDFDEIAGLYELKIGRIKAEQLKNLLKDRCGKAFDIPDSDLD